MDLTRLDLVSHVSKLLDALCRCDGIQRSGDDLAGA